MTGGYQAVDEKVDGGVDYGQVPSDKVSEPLMTRRHLLGLVFDVQELFFPFDFQDLSCSFRLKKTPGSDLTAHQNFSDFFFDKLCILDMRAY